MQVDTLTKNVAKMVYGDPYQAWDPNNDTHLASVTWTRMLSEVQKPKRMRHAVVIVHMLRKGDLSCDHCGFARVEDETIKFFSGKFRVDSEKLIAVRDLCREITQDCDW